MNTFLTLVTVLIFSGASWFAGRSIVELWVRTEIDRANDMDRW